MAASDQNYRSPKALNLVFAGSCVVLLVSTLLMLAMDHYTPFKPIQRKFRDVEEAKAQRDMLDELPAAEEVEDKIAAVREARAALAQAKQEVAPQEGSLQAGLEAAGERYRSLKAEYDAVSSYYNIDVEHWGKEPPGPKKDALQQAVDRRKQEIDDLERQLTEAKDRLDDAERRYGQEIRGRVEPAEKAVADAEDRLKAVTGPFDRFAKATAQKRWTFGDTFRALPVLDAFASPTKPNQYTLNDLPIDYGGFKDVTRYDRCTTCHLGIDRANYDKASLLRLSEPGAEDKLQRAVDVFKDRKDAGETLGFDPDDLATYRSMKLPRTVFAGVLAVALVFALLGGLLRHSVGLGMRVAGAGLVLAVVAGGVSAYWAPRRPVVKTVPLTEGEVEMYAAHPRLDLFVDANSPHPAEKFGCTICHGGQGSATDFNLASHTPNDAHQQHQWEKDHNWRSNHYWDFPMLPQRFSESSCLKCHHQVTDLVRHGSKEEAPKLLRGFELIKENGCFGCHEIAGVKGGRWVGPDLRLEPAPPLDWLTPTEQDRAKADPTNPPGTYRKVGPSLRRLVEKTDQEWTRKWIDAPRGFRPDTKMPHFYHLSNNLGDALPEDQKAFPATEIHSITHYLFAESQAHLRGADTYRKALLAGKDGVQPLQEMLGKERLPDREKKELLEVSRRFADLALLSAPRRARTINAAFAEQRQLQDRLLDLGRKKDELKRLGSKEELDAVAAELKREHEKLTRVTDELVDAAKPTPLAKEMVNEDGNPVDKLPEGDPKNGRRLFTERGCLSCHAHEGTTKSPKSMMVDSEANFGPELSRLAAKIKPEADGVDAKRWLVQWLLNPNVYHPRTRMPVTYLKVQDAADVAEWLLSQSTDWKQKDPAAPNTAELVALARVYLAKAPGIKRKDVDDFLPAAGRPPGIPAARLQEVARDADELRLAAKKGGVSDDDLKWYVGRKAISRLGCFGCHDVPGFETAKPIGTGLNDWGRKDAERLAFEDAEVFVRERHTFVEGRMTRGESVDRIAALIARGERMLDVKDREQLAALRTERERRKELEAKAKTPDGLDADEKKELADLRRKAPESDEMIGEWEDVAGRLLPAGEQKELNRLRERLEKQGRIKELEDREKDLSAKEKKELKELRPLKFWEKDGAKTPYESAFHHALEHHSREGFLHQKLMEPRSYDHNRLRAWDDRLRMPQFQFGRLRKKAGEADADFEARQAKAEAEAREAVMTFILGLVAEPVPLKFVHRPGPDKAAEAKGREVLEKYNCAGCHQVRPGAYEFNVNSDARALLERQYGLAARSFPDDHFFRGHNAWFGAPPTSSNLTAYGVKPTDGATEVAPDPKLPDRRALRVRLTDALRFYNTDGVVRDIPGGAEVLIWPETLVRPPSEAYGGTFTDLLSPYVVEQSKKNPRFQELNSPDNARSALPPPLIREGERVQPDWLYRFLLNPTPIRPESYMLLRMPRFNMSAEESRALVDYFAAAARLNNPGAGVTAPYVNIPQRDRDYWGEEAARYKSRMEGGEAAWADYVKRELSKAEETAKKAKAEADKAEKDKADDLKAKREALKEAEARVEQWRKEQKAGAAALKKRAKGEDVYAKDALKLLLNKDLCLKCHDVGKTKTEAPKGPNLILTAERLRPEWTLRWIANPNRMFPYTPVMPQNFPNKANRLEWDYQDQFLGSPFDQSRAVRDVLMDLSRLADMPADHRPAPAGGGK